jgi:NAD(P)-dependent dehydrogenase (short-subunit alcohol dehydrogenase family)
MKAKTIVTGATGSMGAAAVEALARQGIPVIMACRNLAKAEVVRSDVLSRVPDADLEIRQLNLASLASVRSFAESVAKGEVAALFNNAGVISKGYSVTEDGFENTFAVNYFGPWLLTQLLMPKFADDSRIVNMISLTCRYVPLEEQTLHPAENDFHQLQTYASSKRAFLSFTMELARRNPRLKVNLADPGIVASDMIDLGHWYDPLADIFFKPFCKSPKAGVQPALRALSSDKGSRLFKGKADMPIPGRYINPDLDARIWTETERMISV